MTSEIAIQETFDRIDTNLPAELSAALTKTFFEEGAKVKQWNAFIKKISDNQVPSDPITVAQRMKEFLWPITEATQNQRVFALD